MDTGKTINKKLPKMDTGKPITNFFRVNQLGLKNGVFINLTKHLPLFLYK